MFAKSQTAILLDAEINVALAELKKIQDKNSDAYGKLIDRIVKLHKLKTDERPKRVSPDTALIVGAHLLGLVWMIHYERDNVIGKASAYITRLPK